MMRWPPIRAVAAALREINSDEQDECEVRLQVLHSGYWTVHFGEHNLHPEPAGYWGTATVPGRGRQFDSTAVARDIIDQARDQRDLENWPWR